MIPRNCSVCIHLYVMREVDVLALLALLCFCWRWAFFVKEIFVNVVHWAEQCCLQFRRDDDLVLLFSYPILVSKLRLRNTFVANETSCPTLVVLLFLCTFAEGCECR